MFFGRLAPLAATTLCEFDDPAATVLRVGGPPEQLPCFQAVDGRGNRGAREQDLPPNDIHWLRPFVQKHFQYGEVGTG